MNIITNGDWQSIEANMSPNNMKNFKFQISNFKKAFSLVEIIVVTAIFRLYFWRLPILVKVFFF